MDRAEIKMKYETLHGIVDHIEDEIVSPDEMIVEHINIGSDDEGKGWIEIRLISKEGNDCHIFTKEFKNED